MKGILSIIFSAIFVTFSYAQGEKRIKVNTCFKETAKGEGDLIVDLDIQKDFHIFSFDPGGDGTQIPTEVKFNLPKGVTPVGKVKEEGKLIKHEEKDLGYTINYYENKVKYIQHVKYTKPEKGNVSIYFQICNQEMCERPVEKSYPIDMNQSCEGSKKSVSVTNEDSIKNATANAKTKVNTNTSDTNKISKTESQDTATSSIATTTTATAAKEIADRGDSTTSGGLVTYGKYGTPVSDCGAATQRKLSPWLAFLYGILGGFAGLFFPCTLPMIPMTISFFLKGSDDKKQGVRKGVWYGFSIFLVYFLMSLPFLLFNTSRDSLNSMATNVPLNLAYFAIFIFFAFSLFGYYDISLPSWLSSKVDSKSDKNSLLGIFFMALTLAIVSFSCTGPILGLVLGNLDQPDLITPAMSGFGLGLGLPFALFAMFPNLIKAMPKSGSWLNALKVVFGFIELAFALKFLSNADLVKHWGLLKRETFMILWIIIAILTALYLLGKFTPKKGYENNPVGTPSKVLAGVLFLFAGYLGLDFFGKEPKLISGFPPPKFYSYLYKEEKAKNGSDAKTHKLNGMTIYTDLNDAMEVAKKEGKPVMIDFTGWACVNCRKMEENVWVKPGVYDQLKNDYVIASLYVDDRRELPVHEQFESPYLQARAKTVGDKWFDLSLRHFRSAGQPFYALIDPVSERILNTPRGYTPNVNEYSKWLRCGVSNYRDMNKK